MDEELISKKELLETFGISYGALYRWKRMGLIPEAWFLRRSTSTGQETFFRRDQICQRIRLILDNKEHQTSWRPAWRKSARRCWPGESSSLKRPMAAGNFPWRRSAAPWWRRGRTRRTYCNY